ncbi:MAG TPA: hypothetical protein VME46_05195 [Acidimicrobiales bacterium]|nr:hypothetical protein [Acidimicrobiales bacterium]
MTPTTTRDSLDAAESLLDARKFDQALVRASEAVAQQPGDARGYAVVARALTGLERIEEATNAAWQAVSLAPQVAYYHRLMAITLLRTQPGLPRHAVAARLANATNEANAAVRLAPSEATNYVVLAECLARAGDRRQADAAARKALQLAPHSASTWVIASFVASRAHNWYAAEIAARKALAIDPGNYAATNNLGAALRGRGRVMQSAVAFAGAARIDPRSPTARDNVENVGFHFIRLALLVAMLPLALVWPLWVAAGVGVKRWLDNKPPRLMAAARRLGLWVAASPRHQRRYRKEVARAEKMAARVGPDGWSSLRKYAPDAQSFYAQLLSTGLLAVLFAALVPVARNLTGTLFCSVAAIGLAGVFAWRLRVYRRKAREATAT